MLFKIIIVVTFLIITTFLIIQTKTKTMTRTSNQHYINYENYTNCESSETINDDIVNPLVKLQINGFWQISHNEKAVSLGPNTGNKTTNLTIPNMKYHDTIKIIVAAQKEKGGIIGYIEVNGEKYVTNTKNFKISGQHVEGDGKGLGAYSGGKYMGCFIDKDSESYLGNNGTISCQTYCENNNGIWTPPVGSDCVSATIYGDTSPEYCQRVTGLNNGLNSCQCKLSSDSDSDSEPNNLRALKNRQRDINNISDCHKAAVNEKHLYYGLQKGGECWTGSDYNKYGILQATKCGMRCQSNGGEMQYCGGMLANQVYSTFTEPEIMTMSDQQIKPRAADIPSNAFWLLPKQGDLVDTWPDGYWEYIWTYQPPDKIPFCNYPKYVEYQPSGCDDYTNEYTCWKTQKQNYKVDPKRCRRIYQNNIPVGTDSSFRILNRAYRKATTYPNGVDSGLLEQYLQKMSDTYQAACQLIKEASNPSYYQGLCLKTDKKRQEQLNEACLKVTDDKKIPVTNLDDYQDCEPGSLECYQLKELCEDGDNCFNETSKSGPRCYVPPILTKYVGLNSSGFYSAIAKASELAKMSLHQKSPNGINFSEQAKSMMNLARRAQFNTGDQSDCNCYGNLKNNNKLGCYPC